MLDAPFIVVLDANVLFPFTLRDTLLRAAAAGLYQVRWSAQIVAEATRNLVATGTLTEQKARRLEAAMTKHFREAAVDGYEALVAAMENDAKDRHLVTSSPRR